MSLFGWSSLLALLPRNTPEVRPRSGQALSAYPPETAGATTPALATVGLKVALLRCQSTHRLIIGHPCRPAPPLSRQIASESEAPQWRVACRFATRPRRSCAQATARAFSARGLSFCDAIDSKGFEWPACSPKKACIYQQRPMRLAALLLRPDSAQATMPAIAKGEPAPEFRSLHLRHSMPLHVRYATCAVAAGQPRLYPEA
ncbi:hypothetical protein AUC43_17740 [Hymenobacter sedentarius]|uniref:Uncharacterized protein n=1 Tax=Hymenobacter sedentarius TaxID=1411621 RepID=A0A0U3SKM9_9BACT|nr:hypothetical protein AUC43_17740 [Hymenobacter sedentarius]